MMRIAKIVLASLAGLLLLALIALLVATLVIDPDTYRPAIQHQLTEALGRDVSIERLSVGRSLHPTIAVTGVRIANAPWASQPNFLSVKSASVRLDLIPLIHGEVEIGSVNVDGVELSLERDGKGTGNWEFSGETSPGGGNEPVTLPDFDRVSLHNLDVTWRSSDGSAVGVQLPSVEAVLRAGKPLEVNATVVYRKVPIQAHLAARHSLQSALAGGPVSASLTLNALRTRLDLDLDLQGLTDYKHFDATVVAHGERVGALSALLARDLPNWGPYAVSAKVAVNNGHVEISQLRSVVNGLPGNAPFAIRKVTVNSGLLSLGAGVPTTVTLSGDFDGLDFMLDATTADVFSLANGLERVPLSAKARVSGFRLGADGEMDFSGNDFTFDFASYVKGDARIPARIIGNVEMSKPLEVDLNSAVSGNQLQVSLTGLKGEAANCSITGELTVQYSSRVRVDGGLALGRFDAGMFDDFSVTSRTPSSGKSQGDSSSWMSALDADLRLRAREIVGLPVTVSKLSGRAILRGGRLAVQDFRGSVNEQPLLVSAGFQYRKNRPYIDADISLPVLDLARLSGPADNEKAGRKEEEAKKQASETKRGESALDSPLPVAFLRTFDADVRVAIAQLKGASVNARRLRASAQLQRGRLLVPELDATTAGVTSRSTLTLDATRDDARLRATTQSRQVVLAELFNELDVKSQVLGNIGNAAVTVDTHGETLRKWLRNAKARATIGVSKLRLLDHNQELDIKEASVLAGPDVPVQAELQGNLEQYPVKLTATGGRLADLLFDEAAWPQINAEIHSEVRKLPVAIRLSSALDALRAGRDVPLRLDVHTPNGSVVAVGTIADMQHPEQTPLDVAIRLKSLQHTAWRPDQMVLPDIPLAASAKFTFGDELIAFDSIRIKAGQTDLAGDIHLNRGKRLKLSAEFSGNLLDLGPWIPKPEQQADKEGKKADKDGKKANKAASGEKAGTGEETGNVSAGESSMDQPFDLEPMRKIDAALTLRARRVISRQLDLSDLVLDGKLNEGVFNFSGSITEGGTSLTARVDARTDVPALAIRFKTTDLDLELLKLTTREITQSSPKVTINAQFAGSGATPRKIYASSRGVAVISAGPGKITTTASPFLMQTLSANLLQVLLPGKKPADFNQLECAAARFDVKDGVADSTNGIALRFKRMDILGSGAINLTSGKILFGFKAVRRHWLDFSILSIASDFASVTGTIDHPQVGLDTQGVLITGGAAWATAGLSLLATNFLRTLSSSENPCTAILEKGRTASDPLDALMKSLQLPDKP